MSSQGGGTVIIGVVDTMLVSPLPGQLVLVVSTLSLLQHLWFLGNQPCYG